ncbi:hypothetical protein KDL29_16230, partial [bacterium]|nr:hypothetical protein [bacterium]
MKTHVNWCKHLGLTLVALTVVFVAASCGGNGSGLTANVETTTGTSNTVIDGGRNGVVSAELT